MSFSPYGFDDTLPRLGSSSPLGLSPATTPFLSRTQRTPSLDSSSISEPGQYLHYSSNDGCRYDQDEHALCPLSPSRGATRSSNTPVLSSCQPLSPIFSRHDSSSTLSLRPSSPPRRPKSAQSFVDPSAFSASTAAQNSTNSLKRKTPPTPGRKRMMSFPADAVLVVSGSLDGLGEGPSFSTDIYDQGLVGLSPLKVTVDIGSWEHQGKGVGRRLAGVKGEEEGEGMVWSKEGQGAAEARRDEGLVWAHGQEEVDEGSEVEPVWDHGPVIFSLERGFSVVGSVSMQRSNAQSGVSRSVSMPRSNSSSTRGRSRSRFNDDDDDDDVFLAGPLPSIKWSKPAPSSLSSTPAPQTASEPLLTPPATIISSCAPLPFHQQSSFSLHPHAAVRTRARPVPAPINTNTNTFLAHRGLIDRELSPALSPNNGLPSQQQQLLFGEAPSPMLATFAQSDATPNALDELLALHASLIHSAEDTAMASAALESGEVDVDKLLETADSLFPVEPEERTSFALDDDDMGGFGEGIAPSFPMTMNPSVSSSSISSSSPPNNSLLLSSADTSLITVPSSSNSSLNAYIPSSDSFSPSNDDSNFYTIHGRASPRPRPKMDRSVSSSLLPPSPGFNTFTRNARNQRRNSMDPSLFDGPASSDTPSAAEKSSSNGGEWGRPARMQPSPGYQGLPSFKSSRVVGEQQPTGMTPLKLDRKIKPISRRSLKEFSPEEGSSAWRRARGGRPSSMYEMETGGFESLQYGDAMPCDYQQPTFDNFSFAAASSSAGASGHLEHLDPRLCGLNGGLELDLGQPYPASYQPPSFLHPSSDFQDDHQQQSNASLDSNHDQKYSPYNINAHYDTLFDPYANQLSVPRPPMLQRRHSAGPTSTQDPCAFSSSPRLSGYTNTLGRPSAHCSPPTFVTTLPDDDHHPPDGFFAEDGIVDPSVFPPPPRNAAAKKGKARAPRPGMVNSNGGRYSEIFNTIKKAEPRIRDGADKLTYYDVVEPAPSSNLSAALIESLFVVLPSTKVDSASAAKGINNTADLETDEEGGAGSPGSSASAGGEGEKAEGKEGGIQYDKGRSRKDDSEMRYKCLVTGCERAFPRRSAIVNHIQTHLEDKPFVCAHGDCRASFVRQHDLRRHEKIHNGTKSNLCACGKAFARQDALTRHRQRNICEGGFGPMPENPIFPIKPRKPQQQPAATRKPRSSGASSTSTRPKRKTRVSTTAAAYGDDDDDDEESDVEEGSEGGEDSEYYEEHGEEEEEGLPRLRSVSEMEMEAQIEGRMDWTTHAHLALSEIDLDPLFPDLSANNNPPADRTFYNSSSVGSDTSVVPLPTSSRPKRSTRASMSAAEPKPTKGGRRSAGRGRASLVEATKAGQTLLGLQHMPAYPGGVYQIDHV